MTRVVYLDINARFLNPTRSLLPAVLADGNDVSFFGPGYVSSERLARGLDAFVEETGPYDVVATNSHVVFADSVEPFPDERTFRRNYAFQFPGADVLQLPEIARTLSNLKMPRVGIFLESDYYNWSKAEIDRIDQRLDLVVGFGGPFWGPRAAMPHLAAERFAAQATDAWFDWLEENPARIVPMLPMIGTREFSYTPLAHRAKLWSVLGIDYAARAEASNQLKLADLNPTSTSHLRRLFGALKRLGIVRHEKELFIDVLNRDFFQRLAAARYSFTCGSGLNMPIRKFFEIPAAGAVLICRPFFGFSEAGFSDKLNAIVCEPEDILGVHRLLQAEPDWAQSIADAGRKLIARSHSVSARAQQFSKILERIVRREPIQARWCKGELRFASDSVLP